MSKCEGILQSESLDLRAVTDDDTLMGHIYLLTVTSVFHFG
ncbi:MAG: hypothetical protein WAU01_07370 [Saprospiraceae bacterium]